LLKAAYDEQGDELSLKYKRVSIEDAELGWNEVFEASLDSCMHGMYCQQGADCQVRYFSCVSVDAVLSIPTAGIG